MVSPGTLTTYAGGAPREHDDADDERQQDARTDAQNPCYHDEKTTYARQIWVFISYLNNAVGMIYLVDGVLQHKSHEHQLHGQEEQLDSLSCCAPKVTSRNVMMNSFAE